jgi:anhydro-N-acetylmuramic acid kinase
VIDRLRSILERPSRIGVGLMSGTSLDGIDAAVVRIHGSGGATRVELLHFVCTPFSTELRARLLRAAAGEPLACAEHARLHFAIADVYAAAALSAITAAGLGAAEVDFLAAHGQTLFHHAPVGTGVWSVERATWQSGSLPALAARTGILVVGDFRAADVALGGTGAPLVPYVDALLRTSPTEHRVLLNVGGIANLTFLPAGVAPENVAAWDVGPGNMIADALAREFFDLPHDPAGSYAARGRADDEVVTAMLAAPFFTQPAPKSAGREEFGAAAVERLRTVARSRGLDPEDLLATAIEFTARAVALARSQPPLAGAPLDALYVSGGGRQNATLLARLTALLHPVAVHGFESLGLDPNAKEAVDFAVLGNETLHGRATNVAGVTGARRPCILGSLSFSGWSPTS